MELLATLLLGLYLSPLEVKALPGVASLPPTVPAASHQAESTSLTPFKGSASTGECSLFCPEGDVCVISPATDKPACVTPVPCGGLLGLSCSLGQVCVDDPRDTCDSQGGDADCSGLCVEMGGY